MPWEKPFVHYATLKLGSYHAWHHTRARLSQTVTTQAYPFPFSIFKWLMHVS